MKNTACAILGSYLVLTGAAVFADAPAAPMPDGAAAPGEREFNSCKKTPAGKRVLKLNLKPDSEISDVIAWFSAISCAEFILPGQAVLQGRKVTILATQLLTPEEAYHLLLGALESVSLKIEPAGRFLRVVPGVARAGAASR
jgi:hypothetical protein